MTQTNKKTARRSPVRTLSVRDEISEVVDSCEAAAGQVRDDLLIREVETAVKTMADTVNNFGTVWLSGNGPGFCLAVDTAQKLSTTISRTERPTRSCVLGLNGAVASTSFGKLGSDDALGEELMINGRRGDVLWCFANDAGSKATLNLVKRAHNELGIPVILFTVYPGLPLVRFCDVKVRIQTSDELDRSGFCVEQAHKFLANIVCNQLKRISRKAR